jgi:F-type H+-transporting ATPase subunit b
MEYSGTSRNWLLAAKTLTAGTAVLFTCASTAFAAGIQVIPDSSVIIQVINFIFLIWVMNIILYKPIRKIITERKNKVRGLEGSIEGLHQDAQEKDMAYSDGIKDARAKGLSKKETLVQAASEEEKKMIEEIMSRSQTNLIEIREKIAKDTEEVRASLQKDVDSFAEEIGQKILGRAF